jgi:hypothetical protein
VELVAEVPLALPEEVTGAGVDTVSVIVTFTEALGSRAYEAATALTGAQPELTYQVAEPSVRVVISGPVEELDQVGPEQIDVEIPVAGLALGDNAVMPTVRSPRGTTVVSITPETVRVTVAEAP